MKLQGIGRRILALVLPVGMLAAPAAAAAQGFGCGANNPLTENTRPKAEERKTNSGTLSRDRIEAALARMDGKSSKQGLHRGRSSR